MWAAGQSQAVEPHPSKSVQTREGEREGRNLPPLTPGVQGPQPLVLFRLGFLQRKPKPARQRPPEGGTLHRPPTRWGPGHPAAAQPPISPRAGSAPPAAAPPAVPHNNSEVITGSVTAHRMVLRKFTREANVSSNP